MNYSEEKMKTLEPPSAPPAYEDITSNISSMNQQPIVTLGNFQKQY